MDRLSRHLPLIQSILRASCAVEQKGFFDALIRRIDDHFLTMEKTTVAGAKKNTNGIKGEFFEVVCLLLMRNDAFPDLEVEEAYLLSDMTAEMRQECGLGKQDNGIDMVVRDRGGKLSAVQCKYRKKPNKSSFINPHTGKRQWARWGVTFMDLMTFQGLCRLNKPKGGWLHYIVMTNSPGNPYKKAGKGKKDYALLRKDFKAIPKDKWLSTFGMDGKRLGSTPSVAVEEESEDLPNIDDMREKRLARFG